MNFLFRNYIAMKFVILGGGIAGLSAAHSLRMMGYSKIVVLEMSNRLGGWIQSHKTDDGSLYELGPRSLRFKGNGKNTLELVHELGLTDKCLPVLSDHPASTDRRIKVDGSLIKLPTSLKSLFQTSPPFSKPLIMSILNDFKTKEFSGTDDSMHSFISRRFSPEIAKYIINPVLRGIFAGSSEHLSIRALIPNALELERKYGSFIKGTLIEKITQARYSVPDNQLAAQAQMQGWTIWSMEGGLSTMVDALEEKLKSLDVQVLTDTRCTGLKFSKYGVEVSTPKQDLMADHVISCLPANQLEPLVQSAENGSLSKLLGEIPFVTVGVVNLEYAGNVLPEPSFGYLIPSTEPGKVLGVVYDTCAFPQGNKTIFTVMMGGHWFKEHFGDHPSEEELLNVAVEEITSTLNIKQPPVNSKVSIHRNCIPQYTVGHFERVQKIEALVQQGNYHLTLAGGSYHGVGINDIIFNAQSALARFKPICPD